MLTLSDEKITKQGDDAFDMFITMADMLISCPDNEQAMLVFLREFPDESLGMLLDGVSTLTKAISTVTIERINGHNNISSDMHDHSVTG